MGAIDEDTITIYKYNSTTEITDYYWTGSFDNNIDINEKNERSVYF